MRKLEQERSIERWRRKGLKQMISNKSSPKTKSQGKDMMKNRERNERKVMKMRKTNLQKEKNKLE